MQIKCQNLNSIRTNELLCLPEEMQANCSPMDVLIIGGGFSGVLAAIQLKNSGISSVLLEARSRLGGRAFSLQFQGERVDLGGQWIGPDHKKMYRLLAELGLKTSKQPCEGKALFCRNGRLSSYDKPSLIIEEGYSLKDLQDFQDLIEKLDSMAKNEVLSEDYCSMVKKKKKLIVQMRLNF